MNNEFLDENLAFEKSNLLNDFKKGFNLLMAYALFDVLIRLFYFLIYVYRESQKTSTNSFELYKRFESVYIAVDWFSILGRLTILLIAIIKVRSNGARALFIIMAVLQIAFFAYFQIKK